MNSTVDSTVAAVESLDRTVQPPWEPTQLFIFIFMSFCKFRKRLRRVNTEVEVEVEV